MTTSEPTPGQPVAGVAPQYIAAVHPTPSNGLGTTALVCGIVGAALCWVPVLGFILGVLATTFGAIGLVKANKGEATNKGMAIAGLVLGVVALVFWPIVLVIAAASAPVFIPPPPPVAPGPF